MIAAFLVLGVQTAPSTADFFPLTPGLRRTYEEKTSSTSTVVEEIGATKTVEGKPAVSIITKSQFGQILDTKFYRIDGPVVMLVGYGEERSLPEAGKGNIVDLNAKLVKTQVVMPLTPAIPVFRWDGKSSEWSYAEIPKLEGREQEATVIKGTAKPGPIRTILGRKVETIEAHAEVTLGVGEIAQKIVENSVYAKGIGLVEFSRKATLQKKTNEIKSKLVAISLPGEAG